MGRALNVTRTIIRIKQREAGARFRANHPKQQMTLLRKKKFGMTEIQFQEMRESQGGDCKIGRKPEIAERNEVVIQLAVDHCHVTKKIRGLLCQKCNTALGLVDESASRLTYMIQYLLS